ncbi:uncharacterized protein LOC108734046 isoform X2 [Agrilus planipennis]|uniref:Uncharacterized protein LOC108734046 isoform X2 n=1 Tax=Agrilus planipennis TaxID=224129 RepID=A0A1W4WAC1_AGRPL|nr:uncharacterized protein LOC108734046 isoform X2 [Agrilus planipennis]
MTIYCCVTRCRVTSDSGAQLFQIPKSEERPLTRERWLKKLNMVEPVPELLFLCEKHYTIMHDESQEEPDFKSGFPWDPVTVKIDKEENNLQMKSDEGNLELNLKTFVIYPNKDKSEENNDVYEILANLQSTETSSHSSIATEDLGQSPIEAPVTHCDIVFTNPFLESNTTIELESSENEDVETNKIQCVKVVPIKNLQEKKNNKTALSKVKRKKKRKQPNANHKNIIKGIMNNLKKTIKRPSLPKKPANALPIVTITVDSSEDEIHEIKQLKNSTTDGECNSPPDVAQGSEQNKSSEVLMLEEKLRKARKRVSEVNQELHMMERNLRYIFESDQIRRLKEEYKKSFKWKARTLKKALQLYFICGESGYKLLLNQNYPLPSISVLRRVIFDYKVGSGVVGTSPQVPSVKCVKDVVDELITNQMQK